MSDDPSSNGPGQLLHESAEELYEMAPCGYLTTTIDGRIVNINRTLLEWLGYQRGELVGGKRFVELLTIGGRMFYETHFSLLLRMKDAVDEIALDINCKDGRVLPALINARQKRNAAGEPVVNRFTVFNSSERRMYERQLLSARDLLQVTLASIGDAVVATDVDGRVTFMNPVAENLSGWTVDAARGKRIEEVLVFRRDNTSESVESPITVALREKAPVQLANHTVLLSKDGRIVPIDDSASPIRDAGGEVVGAVLVFRDISDQRIAQRKLEEAYDQLEKSAAELRRSNDDLSQFAHVASHDLRSPLNTIVQFTQLLENKYGSKLGEDEELLGHLTGAARRMGSLIEDLLSYAHTSADGAGSGIPLDATLQLGAAVENLRSEIENSGAVVTAGVLPALPIAATSLMQIFQNLIGNAIHYRGSDPPRIHVSAASEDGYWLFSCRDNGIGIDPKYHSQIFEAFKRLHGAERPGSGIGLAVCKKIIERYRGRIWVESEPGKGSTFFFTLPKAI